MPELTSDNANKLREFGLTTATQLKMAARRRTGADRRIITALAARITYCNRASNNWVASDLHNETTGDLFDGFGRYWHCSSKLCSYCLRAQSQRHRRVLRAAIEAQRPFPHLTKQELRNKFPHLDGKTGLNINEHYRFITYTIPNPRLPLKPTRAIIDRAWTLLRKRKYFRRVVVGGAKSEEFTTTANGYHYHFHTLCRTKPIDADEIRDEWTACVKQAFADFTVPFDPKTSDGKVIVNIRIVHKLNQVVNEVCKYITKAKTWYSINPDELAEIALVPQWHRMFEVFGSFRNMDTEALDKELADVSDAYPKKGLWEDNDELSNPRNHWRLTVTSFGLKKYLELLHTEVTETINRRRSVIQQKFPWATIQTLDDS